MCRESLKKTGIHLLKLLFAAGILYLLTRKINFRPSDFAGMRISCLIPAAACLCAQILLTGLRWHALLRTTKLSFPLREVLFLTMQGIFFTLFIPGGAVGGDVIKAGIVAKRAPDGEKFVGVFSILIDRLCGLTALLTGTLLSIIFCIPLIRTFPRAVQTSIALVALGCMAGLCGAA